MAMALFSCRAPTNLTPRPSSVTAKTAVSSLMSPNTVRTPRACRSSARVWNTGTIRLSSIAVLAFRVSGLTPRTRRCRHRGRPDPAALGGAAFEAGELRLRQERDEVVVGMRREAELVVLGRRMRRVVDQPNRAVRLGEGLGEIVGRQVERQRE